MALPDNKMSRMQATLSLVLRFIRNVPIDITLALFKFWCPYWTTGTKLPSRQIDDPHNDARYWRSLLEPQLRGLLSAAGYDSPSSWLSGVSDLLANYSVLGPKPDSGGPTWPSFISDDFSPIEYSISISPKNTIVRFAFEPISRDSGTSGDPVNSRTPARYSADLQRRCAFDTTWLAQIREAMMLRDVSKGRTIPDRCKGLTQEVFAFDLETDKPRLKIYAMPDAKISVAGAEQQFQRRDEVLASALARCGFSESWETVNSYLHHLRSTQPAFAGFPEALGWDAVDPARARMKIYVRYKEADLQNVLEHLDLGGKLQSEYIDELKYAATEMWNVFGAREALMTGDLAIPVERTGGALLAYECKQGMSAPCAIKCEFCSNLVMTDWQTNTDDILY